MTMSESGAGGRSRREFVRGALIGAGTTAVVGGLGVAGCMKLAEGAGIKPVGFSRARVVPNDPVLPKQVDVAIIGGGFIGTATALALAERGLKVAVFEKGVVAGESSGRSGGLVEAMFEAPEKLDLIELSKRRWRGLAEATGEPTGLVQRGGSALFTRPEDMAGAEAWIGETKGHPNGGARMLSQAEAQARAPGTIAKLIGGITVPEDGAAEPTLAAPAMAIGARRKGATIHQFCAVRGIERTGGRVSGVVTERGLVKAPVVVLAGGVWAPMMAQSLGLDVPVLQCFAKAMSLNPFDGPGYGQVTISDKYQVGWRKQYDGGYIAYEFKGIAPLLPSSLRHFMELLPALKAEPAAFAPKFNAATFWRWINNGGTEPLDRPGPYEKTRIYEPELWTSAIDEGFLHVQEIMPVFRWGSVRERWAGAMQTTPDNMPIISPVDGVPGLLLACGFLYGLTMGPGAGLVAADMVTGKTPQIDVRPFRFSRFSDGSKIGFYP